MASEALGCGSVVALWLLVYPLRSVAPARRRDLWRSAVGGALMIAGPLLWLARPGVVSAVSLTMALALTPVVLAVAESAMRGDEGNLAGRLWPGLAAVAGLLLVLAEPSLASAWGDILLVLAPLMTGVGAVLFCTAEESVWRLPAALLGVAAVFALGAVVTMGGGHAWPELLGLATGLDALEAVLAVMALGRLGATRWSAQFALVPLVVLLEGLALMREWVPVRMIGGLLLLAVASAALLAPAAVGEEPRPEIGARELRERRSD
jgi:drug/metabolite transporter (DMT)-like permease